MRLDDLELATLAAVDRLVSRAYVPPDGDQLLDEMARVGYRPDEAKAWWLLSRLSDQDLITCHKAGGMNARGTANIDLTAYGRQALAEAVGPDLEPEQDELLASMVEEAREVPRAKRTWSLMRASQGAILRGPGGDREVLESDMSVLESAGLLKVTGRSTSMFQYILAPAALTRYATRRKLEAGPEVRMAQDVRSLIDHGPLRRDYPAAYEKWAEAEALLWGDDRERELTTIGHKCREAMQEFGSAVVSRYAPPDAETNAAFVKKRTGAVIADLLPGLAETQASLLKALGAYSNATLDDIQRQEHGAQKEGEPLTWDDARRVVFHTGFVLSEFAAVLAVASQSA
jgi:hypothetical protein